MGPQLAHTVSNNQGCDATDKLVQLALPRNFKCKVLTNSVIRDGTKGGDSSQTVQQKQKIEKRFQEVQLQKSFHACLEIILREQGVEVFVKQPHHIFPTVYKKISRYWSHM